MGKDRRKVIEVVIPGGRNLAIISEIPQSKKDGCILHSYERPTELMTFNLPTSVEEILMQLDIKNIKWKDIRFEDHRTYRGVIQKNMIFNGDIININIGDKVKNPDEYDKKLSKINKILVIRNDAIDYHNLLYGSFHQKIPRKYQPPKVYSYGPKK